jgi:phosphoglycolate phosphatase
MMHSVRESVPKRMPSAGAGATRSGSTPTRLVSCRVVRRRRLIAFDLDGTLVDSRLDLAASANELLALHGARPLPVETVVAMVGEGARVLVGRVIDAAGVQVDLDAALTHFLTIYDRRLVEQTEVYPGVLDALARLQTRATLAILTNKPQHHTDRLLHLLGLGSFFETVVGGDTPFGRKPDPAGLRHVMARVGVSREATTLVGDSVVDLETARRAGVQFCAATYGFGTIGGPAGAGDLVVERPQELEAVLRATLAPAPDAPDTVDSHG